MLLLRFVKQQSKWMHVVCQRNDASFGAFPSIRLHHKKKEDANIGLIL